MTKKNEANTSQTAGGGGGGSTTNVSTTTSTTSTGIMIVQQQPISEQQHFVLPAMNNPVPMIFTTPLAVPSIITQHLPTTSNSVPTINSPAVTATAATVIPATATTLLVPTLNGTTLQKSNNGTTTKPSGQDRLVCSLCNKVYRSSAGLRYHKRKRHRDEGLLKPSQLHRVRCLENGCAFQMLAISDLRNHLANQHMKPEYKTTEEKKFNSFTEFTEWKSQFEQSSGSKYVKNCGSKGKSENQTTEYYYCNHKQTRQGWRRNSKSMDASRCGIHCTSSMKVDIARNDQISVQYYPAHYGHTAEPPLQGPPTGTTNGDLVDSSSVQQQTIPSIQTVVQQQQTTTTNSSTSNINNSTTDHCVRLQHQHHAQTSSIIINIAPVNTTIIKCV